MNFAMPFDCSRLLRYAVRAEADCAAAAAAGSHIDNRSAAAAATTTTSFGHPDPPSLHLFALDDSEPSTSTPTTSSATVVPDGTLLVVAFTKHTVSAQLLWTRNNNSNKKHSGVVQDDVKELCVLLPEDETLLTTIDENGDNDEHIRCLTVVALKRKHQQQLLQIAVSSAASTSITSSSSLMKGVVYVKSETTEASATATSAAPMSRPQPPQGDEELRRLAIVFGTNYSRVYTVEVTISFSTTNKQWVLQRSQLHDATSSHSSVFQVFPMDDSNNAMLIRRRSCKRTSTHTNKQEHGPAVTPFRPVGGVVCLSCYQDWIVWITYGDATLLRVHGSSFFPSLWQRAAAGGWSVEDCVRWLHPNIRPLVRCQVRLPCDEPVLVVPLPRHFPSLLTTLKTILPPSAPRSAPHGDEECRNGDPKIDDYETQQRAAAMEETYEALVFGQGTSSLFPTLCFYTSVGPLDGRDGDSNAGGSRNESFDFASPSRDDGRILGSVTKALVGSAMGALRWGFGSGSSDNSRNAASKLDYFSQSQVSDSEGRDSAGFKGTDYDTSERTVASSPFPSLWSRPVNLHASFEFHDAPRKVEFCSIDPDGRLAAAADGLGRVLLIDLASKQLIRMWKGFRDASCYWLQTESPRQQRPTNEPISPWRHGKQKKPLLHLVIHSRQRRVVEVWRVRHGSRVCSIQVGRGSRILPCISLSALREPLVSCYLIHSTIPGTNHNQMEQIRVDCEEAVTTFHDAPPRSVSSTKAASVASNPSRQAALRLQHLQQLLSAGNIQYSAEDVRKALHEIKSLSDLSTALDLLAAGSVLEEQLGVKGSTFHRDALTYCRGVLNAAMHRGKSRSDTAARANPHVQILSHKIEYHTQIVKAFDVLYKFEVEASKYESSPQQAKTPSHWAAEAMAWASTYEQVTGSSLDVDISEKSRKGIRFSEFAVSCRFPEVTDRVKSPIKVYFSESSRTRRDVLQHVFKPLLADVFSFNVVYSIFDHLGIRSDCSYIQKCIGEWFLTISVREAYTKGIYSESPPMVRLLSDLVARQLASGPLADDEVALGVLCKFCEESSDLVRAFMLGALCLEAVSKASVQKEKWSYGKVQSTRMVNDWKSMLRKLRVCLLVSLRMHGTRLAAPVTVDNVNQADIFSVYEWLARDELSMSHTHEEIVSLEKACSMSSYSFDPSMPDGDGPSRFKMLQNSCLSAAISEEERAEYLVDFDDDDRFGALLLFLSNHNEPKILAAHRALLLASEWGLKPEQINVLRDVVAALKSIQRTPGFISLTAAVCVEIWQSQLCPIYRALLFGFADVHQLSEEVISPLLQNREWLASLGRIGLQLLAILKECKFDKKEDELFRNVDNGGGPSWPPLRPDCILKKLVNKMPGQVDESALDAHSVVVCALLISSDRTTLAKCVPAIVDLFVPHSIFTPVTNLSSVPELQQSYLDDAIFTFASQYAGPAMDCFDLGEIETLVKVWSFDIVTARTTFLRDMYELGKDHVVDELLTKASFQINVHQFVEDGVSIACRRLNVFLSGRHINATGMRDIMGLLDADICEWIKQRSNASSKLVEHPELSVVAIGTTHLFVMRLLSLSASSKVETALRMRIHSLVVLSGILVKAL